MAVFLLNICKFNKCNMQFETLIDLIQHIEENHIDYDPAVSKSDMNCLPLSCIQRFTDGCSRKEGSQFLLSSSSIESLIDRTSSSNERVEVKRKNAIKHHSYSISSSNRSNTPTGSEIDEDDIMVSESEDSNESWTTEEFSSEFIMRYGSRSSVPNGSNEKPFACPVPGCKKRYKNVNGIKYHSKNGHKKDGNRIRKAFKCHCGKSYKTSQKLKNHTLLIHSAKSISTDVTLSSSSSATQQQQSMENNNILPQKSANSSGTTTVGLVSIKSTSKATTLITNTSSASSSASSSPSTKLIKDSYTKNGNESSKTKLNGPITKAHYEGLGILTPATSPKNQIQLQNSTTDSCQNSNSAASDQSLSSATTSVSNILSSGFQIFKKTDS